jgi:M6 family metalloprotease-like protein
MRPSSRETSRLVGWLAVAGLVLAAPSVYGYPHRGERVTLHQPDGSPVEVVVWGDERYVRAETTDGYSLVVDPETRRICYAKAGPDGDLVSTGIPYLGDEDSVSAGQHQRRTRPEIETELRRQGIGRKLRHARSKIQEKAADATRQLWGARSAPWNAPGASTSSAITEQSGALLAAAPTGVVTGLVVPIDFSDRPANISTAEIDAAFNATSYGDSRGSIRSWSETISYSKVSVRHTVLGYYRAKYPTSHYLHGTTWDYSAADELMKEVYAYVEANTDLRNVTVINGALSSLAVLYAGDIIANGWANSLWPHASSSNYLTSEGVRITHHYMSNLGTGVPVDLSSHRHELGHAFFSWPDTYDYDDDSQSAGGYAMETDIPCAPFRMWAGWLSVVDVNGVNQTYSLAPAGDTCLRYKNPANAKEYFVVEYMRKLGWNSKAPDEGLLVWHVDEAGDNSYQDMTAARHYELSVEQADGQYHLEHDSTSRSNDLFHAGNKTLFDDTTAPNAKWWSGSASGLKLSNIGSLDATMSVTVGTGGTATCTAAPSAVTGLSGTAVSSSAISLSWSAVSPPANCAVTYSVFRNGGQVASGLTSPAYSDTGRAASTSYAYSVVAVDSAGSSAQSSSVTVTTPSANAGGLVAINCGGPATGSFVADTGYSGGSTYSTTSTIDTSLVDSAVPQEVFQTERYGEFTYTVPGLTAGGAVAVTLYFQESYVTAAGQRLFDVAINGATALTAFDIYAAAGAQKKAVGKTFSSTASASGEVVIQLTKGTSGVENPKLCGITVAPIVNPTCGSVPAAPSGLTATATSTSQIKLAWSAVTPPANCAVTYSVFRGGTQVATGLTALSFTDTGLTPGTTYSYTVRAVDAAGASAASSAASATTPVPPDTQAPAAPSSLSASNVATTTATLVWNPSTDNVGVTGYDVLRAGSVVGSSTTTSATVSNLTPGTSYTFTVRARDAAGNLSAVSNAVTVTTQPAQDTTPPTTPGDPTFSYLDLTVTLSWAPSRDEVGVAVYDIYYGSYYIGSCPEPQITLIGFRPNVPYTFTLKARDAAGNVSPASNPVTVLLGMGQDTTPPTAPTNLVATSVTSSAIALRWTASTDDVGVVVYQVLVNGSVAATVVGPTATLTGLAPATSYAINVIALDAAGNRSPVSAAVSVTTSP